MFTLKNRNTRTNYEIAQSLKERHKIIFEFHSADVIQTYLQIKYLYILYCFSVL